MKIQFNVGTDISDAVLDFCVLEDGLVILEEQIPNKKRELNKIIKKIRALGVTTSNSWFCAEYTGVYGNELRLVLEDHQFVYSMVPATEINKSIGMVRGKNDRIDAKRIAEYCRRFNDKLRPSMLPEKYLLELKQLFVFRKQQVKNRTRAKNYLKSVQKSWASAPQKMIISKVRKQIRDLDSLVLALEKQMKKIIDDKEEAKKNFALITSTPGIALVSACYMIICTENFLLFNDARKFASYVGVAPFEYSSGSSIRGLTRTSKYRNKEMKSLLHNGMSSLLSSKNELGVYYRRRIKEGKQKDKVKNAIVFKMITRAFATVNRQSPYIQIDKHNNAA